MFTKYIYKLVSNEEAVRSSTFDVLKSFEQDGVMHLELRTTPRAGPGNFHPRTKKNDEAKSQRRNDQRRLCEKSP